MKITLSIAVIAFFLLIPHDSFSSTVDNHIPPTVCIKEFPDDEKISDVKKQLYQKAILAGITEWVSMIKQQSPLPRSDNWKWDIQIIDYERSEYCDIIVQSIPKPLEANDDLVLGTYQALPEYGLINMYYLFPYQCETHRDSQYIYYGICRDYNDFATTEEFGSVFKHEFGHALGLGHVNKQTSLMHPTFELLPYKGIITPQDVKLVLDLYPDGFNYENESEMPEKSIPDENKNSKSNMSKIPDWVKNNAKWWAEGQVDDTTFTLGIGYLIKEKIIGIDSLPEQASDIAEQKVPDWIRNNAKWWADGMISEDDFMMGIKYLVEKGIIRAS